MHLASAKILVESSLFALCFPALNSSLKELPTFAVALANILFPAANAFFPAAYTFFAAFFILSFLVGLEVAGPGVAGPGVAGLGMTSAGSCPLCS